MMSDKKLKDDPTPPPPPPPDPTKIMGIGMGIFLAMIVIYLILLVVMIWFSIHVMNKCGGTPSWLNPTIISLLVIWVILGWVPGLGQIDFVVLLIILIIFNNKCKK